MRRSAGFGSRNIKFLLHDLFELRGQNLFICKCHERTQKADVLGFEFLDIVFDVLGVARDNRAVVMVARAVIFLALIGNAGVEDGLHAVLDEPGHMAVRNLGRVALRLRGN